MSNTRSLRNRSSRYSSPATFATNNHDSSAPVQETIEVLQGQSKPENVAQEQTRLDGWLEPGVRHAIPSFEDTKGLERVGVLEHMQPLGVAPNAKLLQKLKVPWKGVTGLGSARATPVYSEGLDSPSVEPTSNDLASPIIDPELLLDAQTTPPPPATAAPVAPPQSAPVNASHRNQSIASTPLPSSEIPPVQPPPFSEPSYALPSTIPSIESPLTQIITSPPRGRPAKREVEEMRVYPGPDDNFQPSNGSYSTPRALRGSPRRGSNQDGQVFDRYRGYVNNAIARAQREDKPEIVAGLRKLLADMSRDEVFTALDNMTKHKQNIRPEQFKVFKRVVKQGIKDYRRNVDEPQPGHSHRQSQSRPKPVAYVSSFHMNTKPQPSTSMHQSPQNTFRSPLRLTINNPPPNAQSPSKLSLHSPSIAENMPIDLPTEQHADLPEEMSPPLKRKNSTSSASSVLSSPISHPEDDIYPISKSGSMEEAPDSQPTRVPGQRQAPTRAAANRATRAFGIEQHSLQNRTAHPPSFADIGLRIPHVNADDSDTAQKPKRQKVAPPLPPDYDPVEIEQRRKEFEAQTVPNYNYRDVEELSMRSDVDAEKQKHPPNSTTYKGPPPPVIHPYPLVPAVAEPSSPASQQGHFPQINGDNRKRRFDQYAEDDVDNDLSPAPLSVPSPPPASASARRSIGNTGTRASTPRAAKVSQLPPGKKPRTMISPRKPKTNNSNLGAARAGAKQDTASTNGADAPMEQENEDQCAACGDEGELLLCDGCPKSFHGECLEPQVDPDLVGDSWYCPDCEAKRNPGPRASGLMSVLIDQVTDLYPRAFNLPHDVRNYFENIKTGEDGEYVEVIPPPAHKKGQARQDNNGGLRPPDYKAERDNKGQTRHCFRCGLTTEGKREIIPCDYCQYEWHLDCLPIPAAVPPKHFGPDGKTGKPWRCPLHVDGDLTNSFRTAGVEIGALGRQPRLRRPRQASIKDAFIPKRYANNGIIDVALEPEEPDLNVKTVEMNGGVFKLSEKDIKLDFIAKARLAFYEDSVIPRANNREPTKFHSGYWVPRGADLRDDVPHIVAQASQEDVFEPDVRHVTSYNSSFARLRNKTLSEQQAITGLQQLAEKETGTEQNGGSQRGSLLDFNELVDRVIADAPPEVTEQINRSEEEELQRIIRLAQTRLNVLRGSSQLKHSATPDPVDNGDMITASVKVNGTIEHDEIDRV